MRQTRGVREFASACLAWERARAREGADAFKQLQDRLERIIGRAGFESLLRRSVALARNDHPGVREVRQFPNGLSEGQKADAFRAAVLAHIMLLLAAFIGEALTMRLLRELWPELARTDIDLAERGE